MNPRNLLKSGGIVALIVGFLTMGVLMAYGVTEEVPIGSISGVVTMADNKQPLPNADVIIRAQFATPETVRSSKVVKTDKDGKFNFRNIPAGNYRMEVYGKAHYADVEVVPVVASKTEEINVTTALSMAELTLTAANRVYLPGETPQMQINGVSREPAVNITVFKVPNSELEGSRDLNDLFNGIVYNRNKQNPEQLAKLEKISDDKKAIEQRDIEGVFVEQVQTPGLAEGIYLLRTTVGPHTAYAWLTVTKMALVTKQAGKNILAYAVDLKTGKPIAGAKIAMFDANGRNEVGTTDSRGVSTFQWAPKAGGDKLLISADQGSSRAYTWFYASNYSGGREIVWTQTDRPIYRPGDTVHFKGIVRNDVEGKYSLPSQSTVKAEFYDPDDTLVKEMHLPVTPVGTFFGDFGIDKISLPGSYRMTVSVGDQQYDEWITIAAYRKPEMKITVTPENPFYVRGERVKMKVKVEAFTGEPVVGAPVDASIFQRSDWSGNPFEDESYYEEYEDDSDYSGEFMDEAEAKTDELGEATITIDTAKYKGENFNYSDSIYTVSASVSDAGGRYFSSKGSVRVGRGLFKLDSQFTNYIVRPGQPAELEIVALENGTDKPMADLQVAIDMGRFRYGSTGETFISEGKRNIRLDAEGKGKITIEPSTSGSFVARVTATDARGNVVKSEGYIYVYRPGGDDAEGKAPDLQIILDKKNYAPGDTATALIRTGRPGGSALVTVEADKVMWSKVVLLNDVSNAIDISDLEQYAPNAQISVVYIRDKEYMSANKSLNVDLKYQRLALSITPSEEELAPGDSVTYDIEAKDEFGKPVVADIALGVVDEGIYQLKEDNDNPLKVFYPRRWSSVTTSYSFPSIYLDGDDKAPVDIDIRSEFKDTAFWKPDVRTDATGKAKVTVKLPDNLTEWRATATAFTTSTSIGRAKAKVVAKKDLMARMSLPAFLTQNDEQVVTGSVTNTSGSELRVKARLDVAGVQLTGDATQEIVIPSESMKPVQWTVKASRPGQANFQMTAWVEGGVNDGLEIKIPILPHGRNEITYDAGQTNTTKTLTVKVDENSQVADLKIQVAPSLAGSLIESLPYLIDYPYGCVEQTLSRFVPAVVTGKFLQTANYPMPELQAKIPEITKQGLVRLRMMQHSDGGWGWWEYDDGSPDMTAKVLVGLHRAREAGVAVNEQMIARALEWSKKRLAVKDSDEAKNDWVFQGKANLAAAILRYEPDQTALGYLKASSTRKDLASEEFATLATAWERYRRIATGPAQAEAKKYRDEMYGKLMAAANVTESAMSWPGTYYDVSAKAIEAVSLIEPNSGKFEKILRYLLVKKRGLAWFSTDDTSQIITASMEYLSRTKELAAQYDYAVFVNGEQRATGKSSGLVGQTVKLSTTDLKKGENSVELRMTGNGLLYYSTELKQNLYESSMSARQTSSELTVKREYFKLEAKRLEDGTLKLLPGRRPTDQFKSGEVFRVRITISAAKPQSYVAIEDPIPSNCRIVDTDQPFDGGEWMYWWARSAFYDDKAAFFITNLAKGNHTIEYAVRAEAAGSCASMPTYVYPMYQPETQAWSGSNRVQVQR